MEKSWTLRAPVFFCWTDEDGALRFGQGLTRRISPEGVCWDSDSAVPSGTLIQLDIMLSGQACEGAGSHMTGEGNVVGTQSGRSDSADVFRWSLSASLRFQPPVDEALLSHVAGEHWRPGGQERH